MKSVLLITLSLLFFNTSFSQNQTSVLLAPTMQNNGVLSHLIDFPNDPTKLLLIENENTIIPSYHYYEYDGNGNVGSAPILAATSMSTPPAKVSGGIVFGGYTINDGNEPVFFDGIQSTVLDVNPGPDGSDPVFYQFNNRTFFIASDGNVRQLFEYHSSTQFEQISNESVYDVYLMSGLSTSGVYFQTIAANESKLKNAFLVSGAYVDTTLRTHVDHYFWSVLAEVNNQVLIQEVYSFANPTNDHLRRLLSFDATANMTQVLEDSSFIGYNQTKGFISSFFEGNDLIIYDRHKMYSTSDGLSLDTVLQISESFREHLFLNNDVYFITSDASLDYDLKKFENGSLTNLYSGKHIHPSIVANNEIYFTDLDYNNMSKYFRLNGTDQLTFWNIKDSSTHPMAMNGATYFDSKPVFLWSNPGSTMGNPSMDIHTISSFLELEEEADNSAFTLFPNPIVRGENLKISLRDAAAISVFDETGRVLISVHGIQGVNAIETSVLRAGIYFVQAGEIKKKFIVK